MREPNSLRLLSKRFKQLHQTVKLRSMQKFSIDPSQVRDITPLIAGEDARLRVMPASFYQGTTKEERGVAGFHTAAYVLPTTELIDWLTVAIAGRRAIEVGAGNGVLAQALGIPATDNRMQEQPSIKAYYKAVGQKVVSYGNNVEAYPAEEAVKVFQPEVVLAAWVTHKFDESRREAEGNMFGVNEEAIVAGCKTYIFVGNTKVHANKSIWSLPHKRFEPPWLYSRAVNGSPDFIAVWGEVPSNWPT